ncbi:Transcription initiation factor TFIID subunit 7 [Babesia sp. Xinjiang]|uniref:Transcription initiation factor TFIID subunit 7 n=1 Tax=Babesia sp. Xinjiang TaxID=462227 RepID=UPI000A26060E|nr:Transcription initiation factor TFIID subunit 7 [Babesia sp. Xinjiang]ORM41719.1 Transcription initiation factor TFIID subunit 7 [Babesia sp. Xinjiang]
MSDNEGSIASSFADTQSDVTSVAVAQPQQYADVPANQSDITNTSISNAAPGTHENQPEERPNRRRHTDFEELIKGKLLARHGIFGAHEIYEDVLFNKPAKGERHSSKRLQSVDSNAARDFCDLGSLDKHCIIRFPQDIADILKTRMETGEDMGLVIEPTGRYDYREFVVRIRGIPLELVGILVELPCHLEAHKTLDCDLLFKSADISQILIVQERKEAEVTIENMRKRLWEWPHGLTPPTKNIRKRRFKDFDVYNNEELKEAEKEALILLKGMVRDSYHFEVKSAQEVLELVESFRNGNIKERIIGPDEDVQEYIKAVQQHDVGLDDSEVMFNGDANNITN